MRNRFKTIIVTGVPGVGKTTVLSELSKKLQEKKINFLVMNFGDFMLLTAQRKGLVRTRDELRFLPHRIQLGLQKEAAESIISEAEKKLGEGDVLFVDTHSTVKTSSGYWPGLPEHVVKALRPDSIVLIEAKPEEILNRQLSDKSRYRADVSEKGLQNIIEFIQFARMSAMASATLVGASVFIAENPQGKVEEAVSRIIQLIQNL